MKFLVDAQLPRRMALWLSESGHDAKHTLDLPAGNRTPDAEVIACASREQRIVVTKDDDFVQSFLLAGQPSSLLLVATGNIANAELEMLVRRNFARIEAAFGMHRFVELHRDALVIHE
jgi:predicted nuclease of predicted toxin-antitoxin system